VAIITKPSVNKNSAATFTLNKADLALVSSVVANAYFADPANWKEVSISYKSAEGNQRTAVVFDATQATPEGNFLVSDKSRNTFEVQKIIIRDFDGGRHEVLRTELNAAEFDVFFNIVTSYRIMVVGSNFYGELAVGGTPGTYPNTNYFTFTNNTTDKYIQISGDFGFSYAIREDGALFAAGRNALGELSGLAPLGTGILTTHTQVGTDTDWKMVSCGTNFAAAIKEDGTLWASGANNFYQLGLNDQVDRNGLTQVGTDTDWIFVESKGNKSFAIKENGTLWGFGYADWGTFGNGTFASQFLQVPTQIGIDTDWKEVRTTVNLTLALKQNGVLYAAGSNPGNVPGNILTWAWINNVSVLPRQDFTVVPNIGTVANLGRFDDASLLIVQENGQMYGIGYNGNGQLGIGNYTTDIANFTRVGTDSDWIKASIGNITSMAIKQDGRLFGTGNSNYLGLMTGTSLNVMTELPTNNNVGDVYINETSTYTLTNYTPPPPPPEPVSANFTSTQISTFKIGDTRPGVTDTYIGPNTYSAGSTDLTPSASWIPYGAFIASSFEQAQLITRDTGKSAPNATTFNGGGSAASPFSIVLDLGQSRTFNQARFYQTFSDGKTTHIRLDVSSDGNLNARTSPNWTPITLTNASGTAVGQVDANGYLIMDNSETSSGTVASFNNVTARYIRVQLYNDGRYASASFTELYNMKLFLVA
jgi:alpha-tubulin suppressor-like RCC1 family protein